MATAAAVSCALSWPCTTHFGIEAKVTIASRNNSTPRTTTGRCCGKRRRVRKTGMTAQLCAGRATKATADVKRRPRFTRRRWLRPSAATGPLLLDRRARHAAPGTEHAAVAGPGLQQSAAAGTVVEELAGVGRHGLGDLVAAMRTGQRAAQDGFSRHGHHRTPGQTGSRSRAV